MVTERVAHRQSLRRRVERTERRGNRQERQVFLEHIELRLASLHHRRSKKGPYNSHSCPAWFWGLWSLRLIRSPFARRWRRHAEPRALQQCAWRQSNVERGADCAPDTESGCSQLPGRQAPPKARHDRAARTPVPRSVARPPTQMSTGPDPAGTPSASPARIGSDSASRLAGNAYAVFRRRLARAA
jgi:hypothetical protein